MIFLKSKNELTMLVPELEIMNEVNSAITNLLKVESLIEQVGALFGIITRKKIRVDHFFEMENLDSSPNSFSIDYGILVKYIDIFQKQEKILLGFFHSHPAKAHLFPSKKDKSFMKLWPFPYIWFIGAYPNKLIAFTLLEDQIEQIPYKIKPVG